MFENSDMDQLIPKKPIPRKVNLEYYGAIYNVMDLCGIKSSQPLPRNVIWQHGWRPSYFNINPKLTIGHDHFNEAFTHVVARKDQEEFLMKHGYQRVHAIGLPICYVPERQIQRRPNTLLIMPVHSTRYSEHFHWNFSQYAAHLAKLKGDFDQVVACVHPSCREKGYWYSEFEQVGIDVIEGADIYDRNALLRMQAMFSSFEYVTTNSFGSQLAYAASFGAKVSIYGDFCEMMPGDFANSKFYKDNSEILDIALRLISEETTRRRLSFLFCHPRDAQDCTEWGRQEVGFQNKIGTKDLIDLFQLKRKDFIKREVIEAAGLFKKNLTKLFDKKLWK